MSARERGEGARGSLPRRVGVQGHRALAQAPLNHEALTLHPNTGDSSLTWPRVLACTRSWRDANPGRDDILNKLLEELDLMFDTRAVFCRNCHVLYDKLM